MEVRKTLASWTIASVLAAAMLMIALDHIKNDPYKNLEARVRAIEVAMECPNNNCDRFKGKDAGRMETRLIDRMDKQHKETNDRIDALQQR